jgi:hypothetical protein
MRACGGRTTVSVSKGLQAAVDLAREKIQHMRELGKVRLPVLQGRERVADGLKLADTVQECALVSSRERRHHTPFILGTDPCANGLQCSLRAVLHTACIYINACRRHLDGLPRGGIGGVSNPPAPTPDRGPTGRIRGRRMPYTGPQEQLPVNGTCCIIRLAQFIPVCSKAKRGGDQYSWTVNIPTTN